MLVLYIHCVGCLWFYAANFEESIEEAWIPPTQIAYGENNFWEMNSFEQYVISFYHSVLMLTGNDIYPHGQLLTILASLGGIAGALVNANIFGNIAIIVETLNRNATKFQ